MNHISLVGRMTKPAELKTTQSGKSVASFTVAVDRRFKNAQGQKEADFINIVVWGVSAENTVKYTDKGSLVGIDGRLQIRTYDAQDGQRKYITEVIADDVQFLSSPNQGQGGQKQSFTTPPPIEEDMDDEIPF